MGKSKKEDAAKKPVPRISQGDSEAIHESEAACKRTWEWWMKSKEETKSAHEAYDTAVTNLRVLCDEVTDPNLFNPAD